MLQQTKLDKKTRRILRKQGVVLASPLQINNIKPKSKNQQRAFESYANGKNLVLYGTAGTGKTFMGLYFGLKSVLNHKQNKVIIVRSVVPSRDMGFLPGSAKEKSRIFETPYEEICIDLFERHEAYSILKQKEMLDFVTTSFLRGATFHNSVVIIDEVQNLLWSEIHTIMTRIGENCRVIICGDLKQSDLEEKRGKFDVKKLINVCKKMDIFDFIEMNKDDIVRSGFVKDYIIECDKLGY